MYVVMHPADGLVSIIWKVILGQVDSKWILNVCSGGSGGCTSEYCLEGNDGLGG